MATLVDRIVLLTTAIQNKFNAVTPRLLPPGGTSGQVLTKSSATDFAAAWNTAGSAAPSITTYSTPGSFTWTKPANAKRVDVTIIGAGGGGGSGRRASSSSEAVSEGGTGGFGGALLTASFVASDLPASVTVVVGAGGSGGASVSAANTNGNGGGFGGVSSFNNVVAGRGYGGGGGGQGNGFSYSILGPFDHLPGIAGHGGPAGSSLFSGDIGGIKFVMDTGGIGLAGPGGGGGGGCQQATAANGGGLTRAPFQSTGTYTLGGNPSSGSGGQAGSAGSNYNGVGQGGSGGGAGGAQAGGAGGAGGIGAGGGGGGASYGGASGAGGKGGDGCVIVRAYF